MNELNKEDMMPFDLPKNRSSVIKVIGVGGGGSNAVNHMYAAGINGVDFVVCNTDSQALENSPVPNKIQLGLSLTEGLGAGANPEVGEQSAEESIIEISKILESSTKMVFITAGMGGGTGTGAAPVIAKKAKELGILTVGIVTSPFSFEGKVRQEQAEKGIEILRKCVDSLVVINNNKLRDVYGNLGFKAGFAKADEVLATAARGIAEVITHHYTQNIDLRDAKTVLANSGTAIMGAARASGDNRAKEAISGALDSPLLNDNHIRGAKNVLLLIVSGREEITIDEIGEVNDHIQNEAGGKANIIMGIGDDESLGDEIAITIIATGFNAEQQSQVIGKSPAKIVHPLEDDQAISTSLYNKPVTMDDDDDFLLDSELERASAEERNQAQQIYLFDDFEEPKNEETKPAKEEIPQEREEEVVRFNLSELEDEIHLPENPQAEASDYEITNEESAPKANSVNENPEISTWAEDDEAFGLFEIGDLPHNSIELEEEPIEAKHEPSFNPKEDVPSTSDEVEAPEFIIKESAQEESPKKVVFNLDDYNELEKKLSQAEAPKAKRKEEELDRDLQFEVRKAPEGSVRKRLANNPMESSIEEGMRLRAEERRAKLKAFNYRFKNNPHNINETDNEPAYKRHGINIENSPNSSDQVQGRMTINQNENGTDLKSNNSFLHDNVD
ncbi:MAG: cell division protein FtsZ [Bacteroidetes bacterium]|nr:MAG: cell division protein FtsZ [Bacteroidota bacterium]